MHYSLEKAGEIMKLKAVLLKLFLRPSGNKKGA